MKALGSLPFNMGSGYRITMGDDDPRFLLPGLPRTQPLSAGRLQMLMRQHG